jgi:polysaccharide deacetylase family protein (PEP-CTERM system associated)
MINGLSFDIEDWFQVENLREACPIKDWDKCELRVETNTGLLLDLLKTHNTKATFFVLGWIAERLPNLIKRIAEAGHEIASHGYGHRLVYSLSPTEFEADLLKSKRILEDIVKTPVIGYRAPSFSITDKSIWALDVLKNAGFKYDSSIFPTTFHDRYGFKDGKTHIHVLANGLTEFPLATFKVGKMNLPLAGGGYFRILPYKIFSYFLKKINADGRPFIFYLHPWEIDKNQPKVKVNYFYKFRHYVNLNKTYKRLDRLLRDFEFGSIDSLL